MSDNSIARVHYFEGQFLRTQDFVDEQAYHVAMRRRHNIAHHTWGIVSGLEIVLEEGNFFLQPGMAVDGYGRELIVAQKKAISSSAFGDNSSSVFSDKGSNELDVWLTYGLTTSDEATAGFAGCGNGNKNGTSFYRSQETAQILLSKPNGTDRRAPKEVPAPDRNFPPSRTPPDDPELSWPVFLGQIINDPANQQQPLAVKLDDRPFVGLVGEEITSPSGGMRVEVGKIESDPVTGNPVTNGQARFGVFARDATAETPKWLSRFEVKANGELKVKGNATIQGNLTIAGGAIEFEAGPARDPTAPPWNIYHFQGPEKQGNPAVDVPIEELRIEMPVNATPGNNRVVIGTWSKHLDAAGQEKEEFHACLTVHDNCNVEVAGDLIVKGRVDARTFVGARLSDAARNAATSALTSGILATSARLGQLPGTAPTVTGTGTTLVSVEELATRLEQDKNFRDEFVQRMQSSTLLKITPVIS
jgi:hypothetical protein